MLTAGFGAAALAVALVVGFAAAFVAAFAGIAPTRRSEIAARAMSDFLEVICIREG